MTIDRRREEIVVSCDSCPEILETDEEEFSAARTAMHTAGWKVSKGGSEWEHTCPACQEKARPTGRRLFKK